MDNTKGGNDKHHAEINMVLPTCLFIQSYSANTYFPDRHITHLMDVHVFTSCSAVSIQLVLLNEASYMAGSGFISHYVLVKL